MKAVYRANQPFLKPPNEKQLARYEEAKATKAKILALGDTLHSRDEETGFDLAPKDKMVMFSDQELEGLDGKYSGTSRHSKDGTLLAMDIDGKDSSGNAVNLSYVKKRGYATFQNGNTAMVERNNGDLLVGVTSDITDMEMTSPASWLQGAALSSIPLLGAALLVAPAAAHDKARLHGFRVGLRDTVRGLAGMVGAGGNIVGTVALGGLLMGASTVPFIAGGLALAGATGLGLFASLSNEFYRDADRLAAEGK